MRYFYLFLLTGVVGLAAYAIVAWPKAQTDTADGQVVTLVNLPERYCPAQAKLFYASNLSAAVEVPVASCQTINLDAMTLGERDTGYVLLPKALPLALSYSKDVSRYVVAPRIGDVNADNVVDEKDEAIVNESLFTNEVAGDIDSDGKVTSEDLALVRLNYGVGLLRPDGKAWQ
jgi:hypothetical protein